MSFGKHNQKNLNLLACTPACQSRRLVGFGAFAMKRIELTQGQVAFIDEEDYDLISRIKWYANKSKRKQHVYGFRAVATCNCPFSTKFHTIYMHRLVMHCPESKEVDHRDHNTLNNQKLNLRICTHAENQANARSNRLTSSCYKGVSWRMRSKKWVAAIQVNKKVKHLGYFTNEQDAARCYDNAAAKCFGEFAHFNLR